MILDCQLFLARATEGTSLYISLCLSVSQLVSQSHSAFLFLSDVARRRQTSYNVARLRLMSPMDLWRNSTPFFGAAAFCTTKIDNFRASLKSVPGPSLHNLSCAC